MINQSNSIIDDSETEVRVDLLRRLLEKKPEEFFKSMDIPCNNYDQYLDYIKKNQYYKGLFLSLMIEYGINPKFFIAKKARLFLKRGKATPYKVYRLHYSIYKNQEISTLELRRLVHIMEFMERDMGQEALDQLSTTVAQFDLRAILA